jgi:hypothetical protein
MKIVKKMRAEEYDNIAYLNTTDMWLDEIISVEEDTDGQGPIVDFDPGKEEYWEYEFKDWNPNTTSGKISTCKPDLKR